MKVMGKKLYKACVKVFNKKGLHEKIDTPWRTVFKLSSTTRPEWRALYKPPLTKRAGDLQWRILHGIIAVNAFISVLNPDVSNECPFCFQRETVFHTFVYCSRLQLLFDGLQIFLIVLMRIFLCRLLFWVLNMFKKEKMSVNCLILFWVKAKMAIYISRRDQIEQRVDHNVERVFAAMIKSRLLIDFNFYKAMDSLNMLERIWCLRGALCSVIENELILHTFYKMF